MQKGFVPILIIILLAAAVLGGYFIYQNQIQPIPSPQPSPSPTDETANWKTYIYPLRFFSLKLPNDFIEDERSKNPVIFYTYDPDKPILPGEDKFGLEIYVDTPPMDLSTFVANEKRGSLELRGEEVIKNWRETKIAVGGQPAIKVEYEDLGVDLGFTVYIQDPSKTAIVSLTFYSFNQQSDLANQILSTFKFLP